MGAWMLTRILIDAGSGYAMRAEILNGSVELVSLRPPMKVAVRTLLSRYISVWTYQHRESVGRDPDH